MQLPLYTALGGAILGLASFPGGNPNYMAAQALAGMSLGAGVGEAITKIKNNLNNRKLRKELATVPEADLKVIKALSKASGMSDTPIFVQTGGEPFDNAMWQGERNPEVDPANYKCIVKSKTRPNATAQDAGVIVIGKDFKKYPVIAHELGHASDYAENAQTKAERWAPVLAGLGAIGVMAGKFYNRATDGHHASPFMLLSAALGIGSVSYARYRTAKREREASKRALTFIQQVKRKAEDQEKARKALETAYSTYEPIRLPGVKPFFINDK